MASTGPSAAAALRLDPRVAFYLVGRKPHKSEGGLRRLHGRFGEPGAERTGRQVTLPESALTFAVNSGEMGNTKPGDAEHA
jgi:hypothetical protein